MTAQLRKIFVLAIAAGLGLLALQMFWLHNEWQNTRDVLQRQIDYAFQTSVDKELGKRRDTLKKYLQQILSDTNYIGIETRYNNKEGKWMITMYDAKNRKDYSSWTNADMPVGPMLTAQQKASIIQHYVNSNLTKNIEQDVIFYYTQRFGKLWSDKYQLLKLDTIFLQNTFKHELAEKNITSPFFIQYIDTSSKALQSDKNINAFTTKLVSVNYSSVNDYRKNYSAVAYVYSPVSLLFKRLWLVLIATLLLLMLTFYCLYRMYKTILQQKQLNELKNDFIGNMTHELKTPIATVNAAIDGLQYFDGLSSKEKTERYLNTSRVELQRLNDIVSKVLNISIYEKQLTELHKKPVDIKELFKTVLQAFEIQKNNALAYNIERIPEQLQVLADEVHIKNVFHNLVDNAIKYVPGNLNLTLSAYALADTVIINIQDNGEGIDEKYMPYLFEKFYRIPSGNVQNVKGFGLGLFYVKQIIQQHGGTVQAQSRKHEGTVFTIILPAA